MLIENTGNHKIAILTFQSAYNFGAVLQAYALQEYLTQHYGHTVILDYHNEKLDRFYARPTASEILRKPKQGLFRWMQSILYQSKNARIDRFRKEYLRLSRRYDAADVRDANAEADVFVTGSDQVWNYMLIDRDTTYFLDFVSEEKITCSYAASIGVEQIPQTFVGLYKEAIARINNLSVRETAGVKTLRDIGVDGAEVMPDPTLLLSSDQWEQLLIPPKETGKYILVYKITTADRLLSFAKQLSRKTGLPVIYIPNDLKSGVIGKLRLDVGPREWLGYIKNAEYVVTNSFHGTVFSILLGTKFFSEVSEKVNPSTSRLLTLLSMFGMEERIISRFTEEMIHKELELEKILAICREQREKASGFFDKVIREEG